jgi:hypothetical protein
MSPKEQYLKSLEDAVNYNREAISEAIKLPYDQQKSYLERIEANVNYIKAQLETLKPKAA